jgi:hypothetical protein
MALEPGDIVWHWEPAGLVSQTVEIPRLTWFPDASPTDPTDYQGNGTKIFQYVAYASEIVRGQPHMKRGPGSYAWLNNNPGNLTGRPGGPDFGQIPGKFNWHNFLIFPDWDTGFAAIAQLLRGPGYAGLSILDAFKKYAPASDHNDPVRYAQEVTDGIGVGVSAVVGELDDDQMQAMQDKIQQVEGAIPGDTYAWDAPELPAELTELF